MTILKRLEHGVKHAAFHLLRPFIIRRGRRQTPQVSNPAKILLLRPEGKIGDVVVSLPVLATLRNRFPRAQIVVMGSPRVQTIFSHDKRLNRFVPYAKSPAADFRTIRRLRRERFDVVIDLVVNDSVTTLILAHLIGKAAMIVGAGKSAYAKYYDFHLPVEPDNDAHIIALTLKLVEPLGIANGQRIEQAPLITGPDDNKRAALFVNPLRSRTVGYLVGINLSAGSANRVWGKEKNDALVDAYLQLYPDDSIVLFAVGAEYAHAEEIAQKYPGRVTPIPKGNILLAAAILEGLDLLITPDTSLTHIARAHGCRVVSLMPRPKTPRHRWRPHGQDDGVVYSATGDYIHDIALADVLAEIGHVRSRLNADLPQSTTQSNESPR